MKIFIHHINVNTIQKHKLLKLKYINLNKISISTLFSMTTCFVVLCVFSALYLCVCNVAHVSVLSFFYYGPMMPKINW